VPFQSCLGDSTWGAVADFFGIFFKKSEKKRKVYRLLVQVGVNFALLLKINCQMAAGERRKRNRVWYYENPTKLLLSFCSSGHAETLCVTHFFACGKAVRRTPQASAAVKNRQLRAAKLGRC